MKSLVLAAAAASVAGAAPAVAEISYSNGSGGTLGVYGQLSPSFSSFHDGHSSTDTIVDNGNSNSRIGIWLKQPLSGGYTFSVNVETALGFRQSSGVSQDDTPSGLDWERTSWRKFEAILEGPIGKLYAGQGSMSADGASAVDLSNTSLISTNVISDPAGSFFLRTFDGQSDVTVSSAFKDFDGARRFRVRYDTPTWNGLFVSASYGQEILARNNDYDYYDLAVWYKKDYGAFQAAASMGYEWATGDGPDSEAYVASASVLHKPSGVSLTLAGGGDGMGSASYMFVKAGYQKKIWDIGQTAVAIDYWGGSDYVTDGSTSGSWGIEAVQSFDRWNTDAYMMYREYAYSDSSASYQGANLFMAGMRVKF